MGMRNPSEMMKICEKRDGRGVDAFSAHITRRPHWPLTGTAASAGAAQRGARAEIPLALAAAEVEQITQKS